MALYRLARKTRLPGIVTWLAARLAALLVVPWRLWWWRHGQRLPVQGYLRHLLNCWQWGMRPDEALIRQKLAPDGSGLIFPDVLARTVQAGLGETGQRWQIRDKVAAASLLADAGIPVVETLAVLSHPADLMALTTLKPGTYFLKPRYGQGGKQAWSLEAEEGGGFRLNGRPAMGLADLVAVLHRHLERQPFLLQPFVASFSGLPLPAGTPQLLRLTTVRPWNGEAVLHGVYLSVGDKDAPADWRRGVRFPIDPRTGRLEPGIRYDDPDVRLDGISGSATPLAGLIWPDFETLRALTLRAADLVPGIPMLGWDVLPCPSGPVFLEGNVRIGSYLPDLDAVLARQPSRLPEVLAGWVAGRGL